MPPGPPAARRVSAAVPVSAHSASPGGSASARRRSRASARARVADEALRLGGLVDRRFGDRRRSSPPGCRSPSAVAAAAPPRARRPWRPPAPRRARRRRYRRARRVAGRLRCRGMGDGVCVDEPSSSPRPATPRRWRARRSARRRRRRGGGGVFSRVAVAAAARQRGGGTGGGATGRQGEHASPPRGRRPSGSHVVSACEPAALAETHATPYSAHSICSRAAPKVGGGGGRRGGIGGLGMPSRSSSAAATSAPAGCSAVAIQQRSGSGQLASGAGGRNARHDLVGSWRSSSLPRSPRLVRGLRGVYISPPSRIPTHRRRSRGAKSRSSTCR